MKMKFPRSAHNWITLIGVTIALIALSMIVFLFVISSVLNEGHVYLGLILYVALPAVMIFGLLLIPLGMYLQKKREKREGQSDGTEWPRIDFNIDRHRNAFFVFTVGTSILLFLSAIGSYEAFHFSESVTFCGQVCHNVMHPEFTAYQHSSHARVACVECHVGSGAGWYVRSKLSGAYQVYSVLAEAYSRPIETPISNLRPARETCQTCHWPEKFYSRKLREESYYLGDEDNTRWDIQMVMKIGGRTHADGLTEGIHWHINPNVKIEYVAADAARQELPWVRYTNLKTGEVTVYTDQESDLEEAELAAMEVRKMDCIDCHNRPSHDYKAPAKFINNALTSGAIPLELPEIKAVLSELCDAEYPSSDSAMAAIERGIREYYEGDYEEIVEEHPELIEKAIKGMQAAFSENIFPEMRVKWSEYPNNIGHMEFNGCFRCHNDEHESEDGKVISKDCNLCHTISAQGNPEDLMVATLQNPLDFQHPDGDDEDWKEGLCTDCHTGLNP